MNDLDDLINKSMLVTEVYIQFVNLFFFNAQIGFFFFLSFFFDQIFFSKIF